MKAGLIYPPGKMYMRGEDRCQANIDDSAATAMRACNDLGYAAAVLRNGGHIPFLRDYQTEKCTFEDVKRDFGRENLDILCISTTNATIYEDIEFAEDVKELFPRFRIILKSAIFYDADDGLLDMLDLSAVDYLIGGEIEFCIGGIVDAAARGSVPEGTDGIFYKEKGKWIKTRFHCWNDDLDALPFPARDLMKNELYVRPDTGEPMATVQTGKGCPSRCTYCLTPEISGKRVRKRSVENVFAEISECYHVYGIRNFFFKADTFTIDREWVSGLCEKILHSELNGKIAFAANSRVNPLSKETLELMKKAGCFMVAFGFETGSEKTMERIRKGATIEQNRQAMRWARDVGLPVYGFFMIGFPWETKRDINLTWRFILEIDPDFIEVSMALPYYGTELYRECRKSGTLNQDIFGNDYFHASTSGTKFMSTDELVAYRKRMLLSYYLRPAYVARKLSEAVRNPSVLKNYVVYGWRLIRHIL